MVSHSLVPFVLPLALSTTADGVGPDPCITEPVVAPATIHAAFHSGCAMRAKDGRLERDYVLSLAEPALMRLRLNMPGSEPELSVANYQTGAMIATAQSDVDGAGLLLPLDAGEYRIEIAGDEGAFFLELSPVLGKGADLTVALDAFASEIRGDDIFMDLKASIRNETGDTLRVDVDFVLSRDAIAGGNDLEVVLSSHSIEHLGPRQLAFPSLQVFAVNVPRNYFFYIRATPTLNNVAGMQVISPIRQLTLFADLLVATPVLATTEYFSGDTLIADATVRNVGVVSNRPQALRFHVSSSAVIRPADPRLGAPTTIGPLSQIPVDGVIRTSQTVNLTMPLDLAPGAYFIGACVDADPNEISSRNNCSVGVAINVLAGGIPDLTVENPSASPTTVDVGGTTHLRATIRNAGEGRAPSSTVRYYLSSNPTISNSDQVLGTQPVAALSAGQSISVAFVATVPQLPGEYWLGACVETSDAEFNTANDCSRGTPIAVLAVDASASRTLTPVLTVDSALSCPGFYIGKALAIGSEGRWGMSILLDPSQSPLLQGGINMGGGFGNIDRPGYAAFNIANQAAEMQVVDVALDVRKPAAQMYRVEIIRRSAEPRMVVASRLFTSSSATLRAELDPGFYSVRVFSTAANAEPASFNMTLATQFADRVGGAFQGGVNVGGVMVSGAEFGSTEGFAAFCIDREQPVLFETFGNESFGSSGVSNLLLEVRDRDRNLVDQDPLN